MSFVIQMSNILYTLNNSANTFESKIKHMIDQWSPNKPNASTENWAINATPAK